MNHQQLHRSILFHQARTIASTPFISRNHAKEMPFSIVGKNMISRPFNFEINSLTTNIEMSHIADSSTSILLFLNIENTYVVKRNFQYCFEDHQY